MIKRMGPRAIVGLVLIVVTIVCALFAPWLAPKDPTEQSLRNRLKPPAWVKNGSLNNVFGSDPLGRDILSRVLYGSRVSLLVGLLGVLTSMLIGIPLGLIAGYYGGLLDRVISTMTEIQLGFPYFLLAIALMAALGPGLVNIILVLGISRWALFARITRGEVLAVKQRDYVVAARIIGASNFRIITKHILINIVSPLVVVGTFGIADAMLAEAGLSFLGFGVPPSIPSWGMMASEGSPYLSTAWWVTVIPGTMIAMFSLCVNFLGDGIRDYIDPKSKSSSWLNIQ